MSRAAGALGRSSTRPPRFRRCATPPLRRNSAVVLATASSSGCDVQSQYDIAVVERDKASELTKRVRPADVA
jgi:hypothetical protein